jgi:hypothetical protein
MCKECGDANHTDVFLGGIETGIAHLDQTDYYYPGLNQYQVEYSDMKKHVTISQTGVTKKYGEDPIDKYIDQLLDEMREGMLTAGDKKEHITEIFKKFSDRKFEDKNWWGNLTAEEIEELLIGVRDFYLPHTALLESGLTEAYIFGKFSKVLTENMSLAQARNKVKVFEMSTFDKARVDYIKKTSNIFWDKAIQRETDSANMQLLKYNRDVTTEILKDPTKKDWRSLTSDVYHSINKDKSIVLRDLDRIVRTETANAQNYAILVSGKESGAKYFFVMVRPTACKICKGIYLNADGSPKKFKIDDFMDIPRDINWGKKAGEPLVPQLPAIHPWCYCKIMID